MTNSSLLAQKELTRSWLSSIIIFLDPNLLYPKEESEQELLIRVKKQGEQILKSIIELKVGDDNVFLSNEGSDPKEAHTQTGKDPISGASVESKSELTKPVLEPV